MLSTIFAMALDLSPITIGAIALFGVLFIMMFGISSDFGGFQGIFAWTQEKPENQSKNNQ